MDDLILTDDLEAGELPTSPTPDDDYEPINMDIESPDDGASTSKEEDEAEQLRKILLEQMRKKRETNKSASKSNTSPSKSTKKTPQKQIVRLVPPIRPPLSPPGFSSTDYSLDSALPPPPIAPIINNDDILMTNRSSLDFSNLIYDSPIRSSSTGIADTPRSPENLVDFSHMLVSSEDSDDEPEYKIDLDGTKKDIRGRKKEIDRLFRKQKTNELEYQGVKSGIEKAKKELAELEQKLLVYAEKGMEINERIKSNFERYFVADAQRLGQIGEEREKWKAKLGRRSARSKERLRNLRETAPLLMSQPYSRPKIIPLNPIQTPPSSSRSANYEDKTPKIVQKTVNTSSSNKSSKQPSKVKSPTPRTVKNIRSADKAEQKKPKRKDSKSSKLTKTVNKLADQLNIAQIVGDGKSNAQLEAELFTRMLERSKKRQEVQQTSNEDNEIVEDPVQSKSTTPSLPFSFPSHLTPDFNFPSHSRFGSLQEAAQNPLLGFSAYRVSPSFPFEFVEHPAVSNRLNPKVELCPFELHGLCVDLSCKWQHDKDFRLSDHDIIRQILNVWPQLVPPNVAADDLAAKLLEMNSVDYVARMLASAIPDQIKNQCFSQELKKLIKPSESSVDK